MTPRNSGKPAGRKWWIPATAVTVIIASGLALLLGRGGCSRHAAPAVPFENIAPAAGIRGESISGSPERLFIFENIGSGGGFLDFDGDGRLDVLVSNGSRVVRSAAGTVHLQPGPGVFLYRQVGPGRFQNVAPEVGVDFTGWGTGVAVGDVDNDGDLDIFLGALGPNRFYINQGNGTFREMSGPAGLDHDGFASSAAFLDFDRDGLIDLYVANYVEFDFQHLPNDGRPCREKGIPISCGPPAHSPVPDLLYRNAGDGRFEDVTARAGLSGQRGAYGLGIAVGDVDRDGWTDILVANDTTANFLWRNRGDGTFEDVALLSGVDLSETGQGQAGMGIDLGDASGDGWLDVHVTNYAEEPNAYYQSLGDGTFEDRSALSGIARRSFLHLGWGTKFLDYDLDGFLDLIAVNGHVHPRAAELRPGQSFEQPMLLLRGSGDGDFRDVPGPRGVLDGRRNHRGLAAGDVDGDGDLDLLVTLLDGPPLLLENRARGGHAVAFTLEGSRSNREGIGARIEIVAGGRARVREVTRGGSYLSSSAAAAHFGLGESREVESFRVEWPSGAVTGGGPLAADRHYRVGEASGAATVIGAFRR